MELDYPGKRPSGFVYDLAYANKPIEAYTYDSGDEFEQQRQERDVTRNAIRHVIEDAVRETATQNTAEVARDA